MRSLAVALLAVLALQPQAHAESLMERGTYLVRSIVACGNCHTTKTAKGREIPGMELAGGFLIEEEGVFKAFAPNITPDPQTGIGGWSESDLIKAIREGRRPDGSIIGPPMPIGLYRGISDRDVKAIAKYVLSVKPVRNVVPKTEYHIPLPKSYGPPVTKIPEPPRSDKLAYGAYLAGPLGHCIECHTPMVKGRPDTDNQLGAGGVAFHGPWGVSVSANITPHPEDGIADYSDADLERIITTGIRPDGSRLAPPMGLTYYAKMKVSDLDALIAYLRTVKPVPLPK